MGGRYFRIRDTNHYDFQFLCNGFLPDGIRQFPQSLFFLSRVVQDSIHVAKTISGFYRWAFFIIVGWFEFFSPDPSSDAFGLSSTSAVSAHSPLSS